MMLTVMFLLGLCLGGLVIGASNNWEYITNAVFHRRPKILVYDKDKAGKIYYLHTINGRKFFINRYDAYQELSDDGTVVSRDYDSQHRTWELIK